VALKRIQAVPLCGGGLACCKRFHIRSASLLPDVLVSLPQCTFYDYPHLRAEATSCFNRPSLTPTERYLSPDLKQVQGGQRNTDLSADQHKLARTHNHGL
jgi:hypothetical protein